MYAERTCSVCKEEASYFCRICNLHYCSDHLCLHLNTAWDSNSWTQRNKTPIEVLADEDDGNGTESVLQRDGEYDRLSLSSNPTRQTLLPSDIKTLPSYTEAELQAQYNFYLSQARRIRNELERRALPFESAADSKQRTHNFFTKSHVQKSAIPKRRYSKSTVASFELLLDRLRTGAITIEQIQQALGGK